MCLNKEPCTNVDIENYFKFKFKGRNYRQKFKEKCHHLQLHVNVNFVAKKPTYDVQNASRCITVARNVKKSILNLTSQNVYLWSSVSRKQMVQIPFCWKFWKVENIAEIAPRTHRILFDPSGCRRIGGRPGGISFLSRFRRRTSSEN